MVNVTDQLDETSELLYNHLYGNTEGKLVLYVSLFLTSVIGPILVMGIIIFEMFGGDSQKRTIVNRLLSAVLCNCAILGTIFGILRVVRDLYGLVEARWVLLFYLVMVIKCAAIIFLTLLTLARYLFIVIWKRMRGINDPFWFKFLCLTTYLISLSVMFFPNFKVIQISGLEKRGLVYFVKEFKRNGTHVER